MKFVHPLESIAVEAARRNGGFIDCGQLAKALGTCTDPDFAAEAYRIIASDILEVAAGNGRFLRHPLPGEPEAEIDCRDNRHMYSLQESGE